MFAVLMNDCRQRYQFKVCYYCTVSALQRRRVPFPVRLVDFQVAVIPYYEAVGNCWRVRVSRRVPFPVLGIKD